MKEIAERVKNEVGRVVVGQDHVVDLIVSALAVGGHVLVEGVPGVAKTLLANAFARSLQLTFKRIQFTPDMLPSDVTGTMALREGELTFRPGPLFANVVLADEINRTPPKTQSALLEAMQERRVTVDGRPYDLPRPFIVIATQNPIEYEGTYPLPEAQLDRFLFKIDMGYPTEEQEQQMVRLAHSGVTPAALDDVRPVAGPDDLGPTRDLVDGTTLSDDVAAYAVALVRQTRELPSVSLGASPRAAIHLLAASRAAARLVGRDFVTPDDVAAMAHPVLNHRLVLSPEAELERYGPGEAIDASVSAVPVPR